MSTKIDLPLSLSLRLFGIFRQLGALPAARQQSPEPPNLVVALVADRLRRHGTQQQSDRNSYKAYKAEIIVPDC